MHRKRERVRGIWRGRASKKRIAIGIEGAHFLYIYTICIQHSLYSLHIYFIQYKFASFVWVFLFFSFLYSTPVFFVLLLLLRCVHHVYWPIYFVTHTHTHTPRGCDAHCACDLPFFSLMFAMCLLLTNFFQYFMVSLSRNMCRKKTEKKQWV